MDSPYLHNLLSREFVGFGMLASQLVAMILRIT